MSLILAILLSFNYSPADSCWRMVSLGEVPERAVMFAQIAARDGGRNAVELGAVLELAGRFAQAANVYRIALNSSGDPQMNDWLAERLYGTVPLDTVLVLTALLINDGQDTLRDIAVEVPLPVAHPPYQSLSVSGGVFRESTDRMTCTVSRLIPQEEVLLPLIIRLRQTPFTFRPLNDTLFGTEDIGSIAAIMRSIPVPDSVSGPGPCLGLARALRDSLDSMGISVQVTGGLLRTGGDSLLFHAWDLQEDTGIPMDVSLFQSDSMRGIAHCPTDIIPLWDLEAVDGHEVSVFYHDPDARLAISMRAAFADPDLLAAVEGLFPFLFICEKD